jgi:serine/threonine protein kinase/tetratricopeptide (TPR) repeat protein
LSLSKHTILFVAANPFGTTELALGREAHAIQEELERSGQRDRFEFVTRWAVQPLDLIRELRKLKPTVVHFSGLGRTGRQQDPGPQQDIVVGLGGAGGAGNTVRPSGLFFQGPDGRPQLVTAAALRETFGAAGTSVKLVVLNACYSDIHAEALLVHVDCVVGLHGSLRDDAARTFAIGFYGGLGERQSVTAAYLQGRAAISLDEPSGSETPQLRVRDGVDANQVILAETEEVDRRKPTPAYPDAEVEQLSKRLEDARARRDKLRSAGIASDEVDREIIELRRQLREGGRLRAGDALGDERYLLVKVVGRGGFAVVWEAYDCTAQQRVAIKVLHTNLAGDVQCRERFFRGAQAMMRLTHPAVTRVLEPKGEDGNFYYFVMEFISGGNLREAVLERRVKNEDTLPLILRIGEALALAHARGMIHRDIKPSNILLDETGDTKLTDFDLVSAYDTTGGTRTGPLGTVVYAAPECLDKPQKATTRADVYGLGMTVIFCLSGQDLSMDTFRNPEQTISKLDCSIRVQDVLRRAVAWEPEKRFADAAAMMIELRNASNPAEEAVEFMDVARDVPRRVTARASGSPPPRPPSDPESDVLLPPSDPAIEVWRKASDVTEAELQDALRACAWDLKATADRLRIPRPSIHELIERNPQIRIAGDLDDDHPRRTAAAGHGDPLMIPGELLDDRFEIDRSIGSGGMGTVFRARDPISGEVVAIKVLSDKRSHLAGRFARESKVLAELSHPGVVRYISHGVTSTGELFLAMEWVDGEVLKSRLERGPLTPNEAVILTTRVAEALSAAHAHGIVHRDLKPSNLIFPDGRIDQVKILDFGLAQRGGRSLLTQSGAIIGTPGYMAPEQARASGQIDARADVFALGCVLFQCLTGVPPFDGDTTAAILAKILFEAAPRVSELWPEVPERLDALVAQMLSKDPALRPSDGANLAAALAALGPLTQTAPVAPRDRAPSPRAATSGERRLLTVVMLGPSAQDDALLERPLRRAVAPYGGRFEQLADGSAVVMLDPDHHVATDHAARAARCALAMCAIATDRPLAIAMGRTESESRLPNDDVIDRASRLLTHMTRWPGELPPIALDEVSAGLLDARFDVIEHESQLRLRGERAVMQGARTLLGRPTSCVGRDWELGALAGILDECIEEPAAQVAVMTAAAGMGKSRLGAEFVSRVRERHPELVIWVGRGDSLRAGSTLDLLAQALRGALGIREGEPLSNRCDKLRSRVAEHVAPADRDRVTAFLGELVGAPMPDNNGSTGVASAALRAARQDAQLMSELMRKAWLDFLHAETAAHPVLLVLEDLHWGDFGTVRFIDAALRDRSKQPWMVLALARPEVYEIFPRLWAERQNVQELRLKELGRRAGERLIRQVLGDAIGSDTVERLIKRADGNAFYLEELIRAVAEGKDVALPETVLAMVETRLARLPFEARQVFRAASVFGEVCWERGVATLLGDAMSAAALGEWLAMLIEQEVLVMRPDSRFPGERELAFRHALLREGAYAMLTADDARLAHRIAGEWLESHGEAEPMVLAGHFQRGGDLPRAARFYLRAAEQAVHVLDNEGSITRANLGLACDPPPELRIALLGIRCNSSHRLQRHALADAEELVRSAPRGSVPWVQGMVSYLMATIITGRTEELQAALALLAEVTPAPGAVGWMSLLFLTSVFLLDHLGQVAQATALEEPFLALVKQHGDQVPHARFWWNISVGLRAPHAQDDPWKALMHCDAIEPISDLIGGDVVFCNMQMLRGVNLWYLGAHARAVELLESVPAADTTLGETGTMRRLALSRLYADRGAIDEARALAIQVYEFCRAHHDRLGEARSSWFLAEILCQSGDLDGAEREIQAAQAMAMPLDQPGMLATLAALLLVQGRAADALAAAEDAMTRNTAMGGCSLFRNAAVRLVHAEALHATGTHDAARRVIAEARTRLLTIAGKIADPSYRTSFLEHVPENARTLTLARAWLDDTAPNA